MEKSFFIKNREKVFNSIEENSAVVLFSGKPQQKCGDEMYRFSPNRNFYYASGIDCENVILFLGKCNGESIEKLYIERDNGVLAKWVGKNLEKSEAENISGIADINFLDEFHSDFSDFLFRNKIEKVYLDLESRSWEYGNSVGVEFAGELKKRYPSVNLYNIYNIFADLRVIKDICEIECIKKAIDITRLGIEEMMRNAKEGMFEYEIEAYFDFILKKHGIKEKAFESIGASGKNGTVLHYVENNSKTCENDLILFDVGAQFEYYNGDLTRTFPVNGKFTEKQKEIYNIVLTGQKKVVEAIKPGVEYKVLNEILVEHYYNELKKIGMIKTKAEVSKYYFHRVSHFLGLETHDIGNYNFAVLKEGMVITVEPGLYIEELGIGIRIEDDVLVTKEGREVLSSDMIKTVEEIENFMKKA